MQDLTVEAWQRAVAALPIENLTPAQEKQRAQYQKELAAAEAKRGGLTAGNAGSGTVGHLAGELFALRAGVEFVPVPYTGAGPVVTDLLAGCE